MDLILVFMLVFLGIPACVAVAIWALKAMKLWG